MTDDLKSLTKTDLPEMGYHSEKLSEERYIDLFS